MAENSTTGGAGNGSGGPIAVMVVDDSAVVRGLITRMLEEDPDVHVEASVPNGQSALQALERHQVEVIILDIEMPIMDGLTALPLMLKKDPTLKIVMASTLTTKNAEISLKAIELGAADYIPKPTSSRELSGGMDFKHDLLEKVKVFGRLRRQQTGRGGAPRPAPAPAPGVARAPGAAPAAPIKPILPGQKGFTLRNPSRERPEILAIGSSTGGPQALFSVLAGLKKLGPVNVPIVITQHMPATFTTILAQHISRQSGFEAVEASDGMALQAGRVHVAPGDYHMTLAMSGASRVLKLDQNAPENFCRPAVDPMFRSVSKMFGARTLALVLTGMGSDGAKGSVVIAESGGTVVAQDEKTSVVWGMPGATAASGSCSAVLPIEDIPAYLRKTLNGGV